MGQCHTLSCPHGLSLCSDADDPGYATVTYNNHNLETVSNYSRPSRVRNYPDNESELSYRSGSTASQPLNSRQSTVLALSAAHSTLLDPQVGDTMFPGSTLPTATTLQINRCPIPSNTASSQQGASRAPASAPRGQQGTVGTTTTPQGEATLCLHMLHTRTTPLWWLSTMATLGLASLIQ